MTIEKNVPIPEIAKPAERGKYHEICRSMDLGESFIAPLEHISRARVAASQVGSAEGKKFVTRSVEGGIRVWRAE